MRRFLFAALVATFASCINAPLPSEPADFASQAALLTPAWIREGADLPVAVVNFSRPPISQQPQEYRLNLGGRTTETAIVVKRGAGTKSFALPISGEPVIRVSMNADNNTALRLLRVVRQPAVKPLRGYITGEELSWDSTSVIHLTGDAVIPAGMELRIGPGARIEIDPLVNLFVFGTIFCEGSAQAPVVFCPAAFALPWGEIFHSGEGHFYNWAFISGGGGDPSRAFGHSGSQPVISGRRCAIEMNNVFLMDNPGKAFGLENSTLSLDSSIVSRCDTGGEFHYSVVTIRDSWFLDLPTDSPLELDDDNDALHLFNLPNDEPDTSLILRTVFSGGKDDGIDHNGAAVKIESCLIENFDNEGIAASSHNWIGVYNTLILNCEQGIEAGYGEPTVEVNHCLLLDNEVGFRFGDNYWQPCLGIMRIANSIAWNNHRHNLHNWVLALNGPRSYAVFVRYSLVNEPDYNGEEGNVVGTPRFTTNFLLAEGSAGKAKAEFGRDMGLIGWGK